MALLYVYFEISLLLKRLAAFFNALPRGSMSLELMREPRFAGVVESIGNRTMLMGTAVWMQVAENMLPALVSAALSREADHILPSSCCVDRYEQEAERTLKELLVSSLLGQGWDSNSSVDRGSIRGLRRCIVPLIDHVQAHRAFNARYGCCFSAVRREFCSGFFEADLLDIFSEPFVVFFAIAEVLPSCRQSTP
jgi:hypothetical protein